MWTAAGERVMGRVFPSKGGSVPLADTKPVGSGIMPFKVVGNAAVIEVVVPVRDAGAARVPLSSQGAVAQLVAHLTGSQRVRGSSPLSSTA